MTEQAYEVRKIEMDHGKTEVSALKDGLRYEIYLDSGINIVRTKGK